VGSTPRRTAEEDTSETATAAGVAAADPAVRSADAEKIADPLAEKADEVPEAG
jgi:hypothetical protein